MDRAVFLDRDGMTNQEIHYLHKPEGLVPLSGVPEATRALREVGFRVVMMMNQAGVARGYYTCQEVEHLHVCLDELPERGGAYIDCFFHCPHHPEHGIGEYKIEYDCRKPGAGVFKMAEQYYQIDKAHSCMIRDKLLDMEVGRNCDVHSILAGTGYDAAVYREQEASAYDLYTETLMGVIRYIIDRKQ